MDGPERRRGGVVGVSGGCEKRREERDDEDEVGYVVSLLQLKDTHRLRVNKEEREINDQT